MKRTKQEILPTLKVKVDKDDDRAIAFKKRMEVILLEVRDINTKHGDKTIATVEAGNEKFNVFVNSTSLNKLIDAFGDNDDLWKGKICNLDKDIDPHFKNEMIVFDPVA